MIGREAIQFCSHEIVECYPFRASFVCFEFLFTNLHQFISLAFFVFFIVEQIAI